MCTGLYVKNNVKKNFPCIVPDFLKLCLRKKLYKSTGTIEILLTNIEKGSLKKTKFQQSEYLKIYSNLNILFF